MLDTSGSMSGFPIEKAKETMKLALEGLNPQDTFNLITFSGDTAILFPEPVPATKENLARALKFMEWHVGEGGTEMMKAVKAALDPSDSADHVRVVCFMTDGYVGNDMEIINEVEKHPNARVFAFGIGTTVNRFLLDQMAEQGRGEVEYVSLKEDGSAAARRFHERVRNPLLTDITVDWGGLPVADVYPRRVPDLFSARPVVLTGRFTGVGRGVVRIRGRMSGHIYEREIAVNLPDSQPEHDELATLWARRRVDELMGEDYAGLQRGSVREGLREAITGLGLEYRLMTQFTSFVAVEEMTFNEGGQPRRIDVPVELPEGVSPKAVGDFGLIGFTGGISGVGYQFSAGRMSASVGYLMPNSPPTVTLSTRVLPEKAGAAQASAGTAQPNAGAAQQNPANTKSANVAELVDSEEVVRVEGNVSPEQQKELALRAKLDPWLFAVVERLKQKGSQPSAEEARFVRDGKAEVQIWLTEKSPEVLAQLKQLGFEVLLDPRTAKLVIGRLPVEKLAALADIKAVRYVAPQR